MNSEITVLLTVGERERERETVCIREIIKIKNTCIYITILLYMYTFWILYF